jgi:hypothetical protein
MRRFIWATLYVTSGVAVGCFTAFALIQSAGVETVAGDVPWQSRAAAMAGSDAFYVRAHYLLEGRLPPAPSQLGEATAETDDEGRPLTGTCSYVITSTGPLPRWWSIGIVQGTAASAELQTTADSDTAVREADGSVTITAATAPQQGNWLKAPERRRFTLLYSALAETARPLAPPFSIKRGVCS